jgi:hypothetical protein
MRLTYARTASRREELFTLINGVPTVYETLTASDASAGARGKSGSATTTSGGKASAAATSGGSNGSNGGKASAAGTKAAKKAKVDPVRTTTTTTTTTRRDDTRVRVYYLHIRRKRTGGVPRRLATHDDG